MIVYVALGTGRGHATRAAAVCRHLDNAATVIRNEGSANEPIEAAALGSHLLHDGWHNLSALVEQLDPSLVVWDADLANDMPDRPMLYVWRHGRAAEPFATHNVAVDWPTPYGFEDFWPILNLDRFPTRTRARQRLNAENEERIVLAVDSVSVPGRTSEHFELEPGRLVEWTEYPVSDVLAGADLVLGAAGCNLWGEVHHLGLDARWVALSADQEIRLHFAPAPTGRPDRSADLAALILNAANGSS